MSQKKRLDIALVEAGLATSRSQASQYIKEGVVFVNGQKITKASFKTDVDNIELRKDVVYVGRGAYKIEAALLNFKVNLDGKSVADIGASTGGFTDYVLKNGARRVFAIDVGHDQLASILKNDPRVTNLEGTNIRDGVGLEEKVDLAVIDLSYISLRLCLEPIFDLVKDGGEVVALVKPQFEAGKELIGKGGIVKDAEVKMKVLEGLNDWCFKRNMFALGAISSPIEGKTGNQEFLFYFKKGMSGPKLSSENLKDLIS